MSRPEPEDHDLGSEPSSPQLEISRRKFNAHVRPTLRGLDHFFPFVCMCSIVAVFHHSKHHHWHRLFLYLVLIDFLVGHTHPRQTSTTDSTSHTNISP